MKRTVQLRTGALSILAGCFVASATLRAGEVVAELPALDSARDGISRLYASRLDPQLIERSEALRDLDRQRAELDQRAQLLESRAAELAEIETRMEDRLRQLEEARQRLAAETARARDAAEEDVTHLAQMYEAMKPKVAGSLFDRMDPTFAAGFLSKMSPEAGAAVIGSMQPDRAYAVSVILASRNIGLGGSQDSGNGAAMDRVQQ